jgi:hypothetical protein
MSQSSYQYACVTAPCKTLRSQSMFGITCQIRQSRPLADRDFRVNILVPCKICTRSCVPASQLSNDRFRLRSLGHPLVCVPDARGSWAKKLRIQPRILQGSSGCKAQVWFVDNCSERETDARLDQNRILGCRMRGLFGRPRETHVALVCRRVTNVWLFSCKCKGGAVYRMIYDLGGC